MPAGPGAAKALRGSIRAEIVLGLMIVLFASSFRLTAPPGLLAEEPVPLVANLADGSVVVALEIIPGRVGQNAIVLSISNEDDGSDLVPLEVELSFAMPEQGIEPIVVEAAQDDKKRWTAGPFILPLSGDWDLSINLLISDFEAKILSTSIAVSP